MTGFGPLRIGPGSRSTLAMPIRTYKSASQWRPRSREGREAGRQAPADPEVRQSRFAAQADGPPGAHERAASRTRKNDTPRVHCWGEGLRRLGASEPRTGIAPPKWDSRHGPTVLGARVAHRARRGVTKRKGARQWPWRTPIRRVLASSPPRGCWQRSAAARGSATSDWG
jgi:hypothetical protein